METRDDREPLGERVLTPTEEETDREERDDAASPQRATGTLGHDTVGVTPTGDLGPGSASGDLTGGTPVGIENTDSTAGAESVRGAAGRE
ncbi:MAG: hypothetical protein ACK47B_13150 [Armatimonadota bacterium]